VESPTEWLKIKILIFNYPSVKPLVNNRIKILEFLISQHTGLHSSSASSFSSLLSSTPSFLLSFMLKYVFFFFLFFSSFLNSFSSPPCSGMSSSPFLFFLLSFFLISILYEFFFSLLNFTCNYIKVRKKFFFFRVFFTIFVFYFIFNFFCS